jgi:hypothetical protein
MTQPEDTTDEPIAGSEPNAPMEPPADAAPPTAPQPVEPSLMNQPVVESDVPAAEPVAPEPEPEPAAFAPSGPAPAAAEPTPPEPAAPAPDTGPIVAPMSSTAAATDTQPWEIPTAAAGAGAAAGTAWTQPAASAPTPPPPPPAQPTPPPASWQQPQQTWQQQPQQPWQQQPQPQQSWQQQPQQPASAQQPAPPPPQQWQQQQYQQPYQQQPYGQQYQQPYAGTAYGTAYPQQQPAASYGTSPLSAFAGLLLLLFGIGVIALGVLTIGQGSEIDRFIRNNQIAIFGSQISRDTLRSVLAPSPGILIFLGVLQLVAGVGVMAHRSWGRWLGALMALIGLVVSIFAVSIAFALAGGFTLPVIIGVVLLVGYALILLALVAGGGHFRRRNPVTR